MPQFIVDDILPTGYVHLIAGPVGMGKTTLLIQLFEVLEHGGEWLGCRAHQTSLLYIAADRSKKETRETIARMGSKIEFEMHALKDSLASMQVLPSLDEILQRHTKPGQLVVIEPLAFFLQDGKGGMGNEVNRQHVSHFLVKTEMAAQRAQVTILGSMHTSKAKIGEQYPIARERVSGSTAWGAFSSTMIMVEPDNPKDPTDPLRNVTVLPRNGAPFTRALKVNAFNGRLDPFSPAGEPEEINESKMDRSPELLEYIELKVELTGAECVDWGEMRSISRATIFRWLKRMQTNLVIVKTIDGRYRTSLTAHDSTSSSPPPTP